MDGEELRIVIPTGWYGNSSLPPGEYTFLDMPFGYDTLGSFWSLYHRITEVRLIRLFNMHSMKTEGRRLTS